MTEAQARYCGRAEFPHPLLEISKRVLLKRVLSGKCGRAGSEGPLRPLPSSAPLILKKVEFSPPCSWKSSNGELEFSMAEGCSVLVLLDGSESVRCLAHLPRPVRVGCERCLAHNIWPGVLVFAFGSFDYECCVLVCCALVGEAKVFQAMEVANYATITDEVTEQAHVYAALDSSGRNRQYSILEAQGDYQGKSLTFLIDSGSSHSFISPSNVKHLHLEPWSTGNKLQVSLASGLIVSCEEQIVELFFQLEGHSTSQRLRVLKMRKFQGILGMDWLSKNKADIHCSQGTVSFYSSNGEQVYIHGRRGNASLRVVKAKQLMKGLRKGLSFYVLKLNKPEKESKGKEIEDKEPKWLSEFSDVFPKELTDLPPTRGLVHDITLVPGSQPIAKSPYKMSLSEALELKNQLTQLLEQSFIKPSVSPWRAPILFQKKKDGTFRLCIDYSKKMYQWRIKEPKIPIQQPTKVSFQWKIKQPRSTSIIPTSKIRLPKHSDGNIKQSSIITKSAL
ncbi:hypothetical protein L7F22_034252 [Adiantum nelumboides]|nr:hypothetical protein [Adiantum nelumboides]